MSFRRDAFGALLFQGLALVLGFVSNWMIARALGPEGKGVIAWLAYALFVVTTLGGLGLQSATVHTASRQQAPLRPLASAVLLASVGAALVCALVLFLLLPRLAEPVGIPREVTRLFLPLAIAATVGLNAGGILIGTGRLLRYNVVQALTPLAWTAATVLLFLSSQPSIRTAIGVWLVAQALGPVVTLVLVLKQAPPAREGAEVAARSLLRFGLPAYLANLAWILVLRADGFFVGALAGSAALGIYSVAVLLAEMLWQLPRALNLALTPRVAAGTPADALAWTLRGTRVGLALVSAGAVTLALVAGPLIRFVFGESFAPAVRPLLCLLPGMAANALAAPLSLCLTQQIGRPGIAATISLAALVLNVALNLALVPTQGALGAALASSLTYGSVAAASAIALRRRLPFRWRDLLWLRAGDLRSIGSSRG